MMKLKNLMCHGPSGHEQIKSIFISFLEIFIVLNKTDNFKTHFGFINLENWFCNDLLINLMATIRKLVGSNFVMRRIKSVVDRCNHWNRLMHFLFLKPKKMGVCIVCLRFYSNTVEMQNDCQFVKNEVFFLIPNLNDK